MSEQINTPKMRFPEFRDEWEMKIIKELFNVVSGSTPLRSNTSYYENGNIPWVKTTDLNNSLINNTSEKVTDIALNNLKLLPKDTVLIAMYGGFNQIGRTGILNIKATTNQAISALIKKDDYNSKFLQSYLNFNVKQWRRFAASSRKDPNITKKDIEKFKIPYTCREEQEKIGTFFSKLDRQIELEEKKLELLEQQKKGYMQKIFSQELRFKDEKGNNYPNWKSYQLGEITKTFSGGTPKSNNSNYYNGDIPFIRSGEISKQFTELKITENALNNSSAKLVEKGDLLYALYGATSGEVAISKINGAINQAVLCIKSEESINFLLNFLRLQKQHILKTYIQGGQGNLSASIVKGITIKLPCKEEQTKIGNFLDKVEILIEKQTNKVESLKQRKQGLLQKMFV
ncbi:restriction endonuclease subunit S [Staphylococcus epidermidis]|jgi:hypothetical protein|uniref:restriction endonuclease subunit S n=1 Tax=Staphylococcus epidermidis TaxID=1282 RepID=UPI0010689A07|nr:restriction endonuclease subunit S [Staphylococcus epidermidis]MCG1598203.1 restriction endonuclease subunit S [Staphylococcus epidermidis]MCG1609609.1 restriction endonuclease subunit S [Staphylococcus epidermidis]MCG1625493.1 restriction endonuclease subunit S [Staphylococcus epidermidis]MCG2036676.1 restriction endonuclease subunit S [Staphylococcus epidermidis]MCH9556187.1 restriction endonuclease subunit S [Staphylococcus epidermidis]